MTPMLGIMASGISGNLFNPKATGGTITLVGGFYIHTFTGSGTFTPTAGTLSCDYLVVAGGGAGAREYFGGTGAGGGGAGGCWLRSAT